MKLDKLTTTIQTEFIGSKYFGADDACERLEAIVGKPCRCYDSKIDDGADDDETEDVYVMRDCFDFEDSNLIVHIYYGDVTREVGYADVAEC